MNKTGIFFSLKWKIAVLIGGVFLLLHSAFSYLFYLDTTEDFVRNRQNIQSRYNNIAHALSKDSFLVLEQFAKLFSAIEGAKPGQNNTTAQIISTTDKNWQQWQLIWGLESAVFFNQSGELVAQWGGTLKPGTLSVNNVLDKELPDHQIMCSEICFQFVMIPVMANSELIGAFGVSRSFADTVIEFNRATGADIGVLVADEQSLHVNWPYRLSAIANLDRNKAALEIAAQDYPFTEFLRQRKVIADNGQSFEMSIFPVNADIDKDDPPFFLVIDDISQDLHAVNENLQTIWLYGVFSLIFSLTLLLVVLFFSLRRVIKLSNALPLLAKHSYDEFRQVVAGKKGLLIGHDELDLLNHTALTLTDKLEGLEKNIKEYVCKLIEQGQELTAEKDFISQLVNVAPILVITQDENGIILSINKVGVEEFAIEEKLIIGSVFDNFIPQSENEHLTRLKQLRADKESQHFKIDGVLMVNPTQKRHISWIHSIARAQNRQASPVILSLGIDVSERKQIEEQMLILATHDQLTGMSNRRNFQIEFAREIASAKRYGSQLALFYLDLDQFKIVNDTSGHEAGDRLLRIVSETLQGLVRGTDVLSRIGGDKFTLIIPNAEKKGIENLASKINESLMALKFLVNDKVYKISSNIGIAIYPQHGSNEHELLFNADLAMYQAKESGRGQYHIFSTDIDYHSQLTSRLYWKEIIEDALENERFILLFQPILDMRTKQISHYECLSRIKAEDGSFLMPGDFIGFAEELGLSGLIDRMVLKKAIKQLKKFKQQGKNIKLTVNLSGRSFNDTTIFEDIKALLGVSGVDSGQIIFEITEIAAVSDFSAAQDLIKKIKDLGCSLALDDFGMGFSSFFYLKHLAVDYVKIDGSFIKQLDMSFEDKVFVRAMIEVSQALGKKTVAEFVENEVTLMSLKGFGIDYVQGYHIGKPDVIG